MKFTIHQPVEISEEQARALLSDPAFIAQQKLDGERRIVQIKGGVIRAFTRTGIEVEPPAVSGVRDMVLDGEVVNGCFTAFDILSLDNSILFLRDYGSRLDTLRSVYHGGIVSNISNVAFEGLEKLGIEGIVFKARRGDAEFYKFKFRKSCSAIVYAHNAKASVAIGLQDGTDLGNVTIPRWTPMPKIGAVVEVEYLARHKSGKLREAVFKGVRSDVAAEDCTAAKQFGLDERVAA